MTLFNGIDDISAADVLNGLRGVPAETIAAGLPYMRAYPVLCKRVGKIFRNGRHEEAVLMVWSWFPAVLRLVTPAPSYSNLGVSAVVFSKQDIDFESFEFLSSRVEEKGFSMTTKILHFCCPDRYPISDSRVRRAYTGIPTHNLSLREYYDEYIHLTHRLREIGPHVNAKAFQQVLQCEGEDLTPIRLLELGLYYIGGTK